MICKACGEEFRRHGSGQQTRRNCYECRPRGCNGVPRGPGRPEKRRGSGGWNKGLSKETDGRVKAYGLKTKGMRRPTAEDVEYARKVLGEMETKPTVVEIPANPSLLPSRTRTRGF